MKPSIHSPICSSWNQTGAQAFAFLRPGTSLCLWNGSRCLGGSSKGWGECFIIQSWKKRKTVQSRNAVKGKELEFWKRGEPLGCSTTEDGGGTEGSTAVVVWQGPRSRALGRCRDCMQMWCHRAAGSTASPGVLHSSPGQHAPSPCLYPLCTVLADLEKRRDPKWPLLSSLPIQTGVALLEIVWSIQQRNTTFLELQDS